MTSLFIILFMFIRKSSSDDEKLVTFFLKLVLPVILKEMQSNFLISTSRLCKNCHINNNYVFKFELIFKSLFS